MCIYYNKCYVVGGCKRGGGSENFFITNMLGNGVVVTKWINNLCAPFTTNMLKYECVEICKIF